jgi:hypothetical protein
MIHAFNFTGHRDRELCDLMKHTLTKHCKNLASIDSRDMDAAGYGNGAGWGPSMLKLGVLREVVAKGIDDNDWVLSIDSDVVFTNTKVFDWINVVTSFVYNKYDIIGIMQNSGLAKTQLGLLNNMSGCSIYLRGALAKKIAALTEEDLNGVREQFRAWVVCENEDIVISYLAQMLGGKPLPIPDHMYDGDLNKDLTEGAEPRCFYHLNYLPTEFLGLPVTGKWDIPSVLRIKGIQL